MHRVSLLILSLALGCSATPQDDRNGPSGHGGTAGIPGTGTAGAGSAGTGLGNAGDTGGGGTWATAGTWGGAGSGIDPNACGGTTIEPETIEVETEVEIVEAEPIAIYIMLDNSGSMATLWPGATQAITDFVNDPKSAGIDVALNFFPGVQFAADCTGASYETPTVGMGRLPAHAQAIVGGILPFPSGFSGTNIEPAIRGATNFCKKFTPADPKDAGEECIVLFITDGDPTSCSIDKNALAGVAGEAFSSSGVKTFTIALTGADVTFIDDMAKRGGGDCDPNGPLFTCDLTKGASFAAALESIRDTVVKVETRTETQVKALECEWGIPEPKEGTSFDKSLVNVVLTPPGGGTVSFAYAETEVDCGTRVDAWRYDDPSAPTRILACPETCNAIKANTGAKVDIVLGCPVIPVE